ncbi:MAG: glycine--tRNA ligase subunit beta [Thermoanaerobaculia bacterium]
MAEYVFELLTEEIPAWMHDTAQATIRQLLGKIVRELGGDEKTPLVNSTPRRISFFLPGLPEREADRDEELKGPPVRAAYDAAGAPSPALLGFLKKNNAAIEEVIPGGDYIKVRRIVPGRTIAGVLQEKIPAMVESLRWPKMMRWGNGEYLYIRPIHSVLSLFDGAHLPIAIFGVTSGTTTVGHRTLAPEVIEIHSYNDYVTRLELARVVIDAARRRQVMAERARILATQVHGLPSTDASIWSQWQYLTEYPGVLRAEFRPEYLELPEEVLVTVMRVHQKQLPIRDNAGKLTNSFLAVIDNDADLDGNAAYGNSFVTNARFADARFFHEADRKRPMADRVEQLSHLQFQEKLGNYLEKTRRIEVITQGIATELKVDGAEAVQAARLCKADLVTEMVKEFTDLQGRVGGIYAREEGLPEGVWQAIYDHYLPVNIDDVLPRVLSGTIVSLADKIDTLVGFFRVGSRPTGSKDPFALRRAAQGVVQILLNRDQRQIKIGLDRLLDLGLGAHGLSGPDAATQKQDLLTFFAERVRTILEASAYGFAYDEIAAAMEAGWAPSLTDLVDRITALKAMRNEPNFLSVLDSARRIANIVTGHEATTVDPAKLENDTERRLHGVATLAVEQIEEMIGERDYRRALESFAGLAPELQAFFKEVMVMVDDPAVRANRMSLLRMIGSAVGRIGDVTKIVVDRSEYRP